VVRVNKGTVPPGYDSPTTPGSYRVALQAGPDRRFTSANFGFLPGRPTAIELAYLRAAGQAQAVLVEWATDLERGNKGFNLFRATTVEGPRVRINASLVPGSESGVGRTYSFTDGDVEQGATYVYWLESVGWDLTTELHGPVSATVDADGGDDSTPARLGLGGGEPLAVTRGDEERVAALYEIDYATLVELGVPVDTTAPSALKVHVAGAEVPAFVASSGATLQPGDVVLFYHEHEPGSTHEVAVSCGENALRMPTTYVGPSSEEGDVCHGVAADGRVLSFLTDDGCVRHLLTGFSDEWVWLLDITAPGGARVLFGAENVSVENEMGVYLTYRGDEARQCVAIGQRAVIAIRPAGE
jgi:hypothetical protein